MINHNPYHPSRPQHYATLDLFWPSLSTTPPTCLDYMFYLHQEYKCQKIVELINPCGLFPTTLPPISSYSSISNDQPPLVSPNAPSVAPPSGKVPPMMLPSSTSHPAIIPPTVSSKGKEPMVVDPPLSSQQISNKTKHTQHAWECQKNHQDHAKDHMNAS